jgi:hypothetical protein
MMRNPEVTRRDFLNVAAGIGGGLVLTLTLPGFGSPAKPGTLKAGGQLNAWLVIGADDSITIIVDRSEMGQGVYTALPMLLAEELEISLDAINVVAAPVGDAYINPLNGGQITGTSNSVQDAWDKLRMAGARARSMLIGAAAAQWRVDPATCRVEHGRVLDARGQALSYGQLAAAAARQPLPKNVTLKPKGRFQLIGTSQSRIDIPGKVDGIDVTLPGMLCAALAQSPVLGGKVLAVDSAAAQALPGVRKVLTTDGGVVVVAEQFWQALQARKALNITWDPGPNARLDTAAIRAMLEKTAAAGPGLTARSDGHVAEAFKSAKQLLQAVYQLPLLAHATMEPMNCTADVRADGCDLYVGLGGSASSGSYHLARLRLRPPLGSRLHSRGSAGIQGGRGAGEADLDARRRHAARRLSPACARGTRGRPRCRRQPDCVATAHHQSLDHPAFCPANHRPVRLGGRGCDQQPLRRPKFVGELFPPGNRHRRRLHALRQPCAELLCDRELHGRTRRRGRTEPL